MEYDFAFSFAGEDRETVKSIKDILVDKNYKVFYDNDFQHELVGKDLYRYFRNIYKDSAKYVVCSISEQYAKKIWTNLELSAIKERFMATFFACDFLIPILIGNADMLKDVPSYIGFYKHKTVQETADLLIKKFETSLIEDNYLINIDNFIKYICENLCNILNTHGCHFSFEHNKIFDTQKNSSFIFTTDKVLNIPCILLMHNSLTNPDLFISWSNEEQLLFNIYNFTDIMGKYEKLNINQLIDYLGNHIRKFMEK